MEKEKLNSAMNDVYYDQIGSDTSIKVVSIKFLLIIMLVKFNQSHFMNLT